LNKVKQKKKPQNTIFKVNFLNNTKRKKNIKKKILEVEVKFKAHKGKSWAAGGRWVSEEMKKKWDSIFNTYLYLGNELFYAKLELLRYW